MIREKVSHKDYFKLAKENDFFLWHFLQKEQHTNKLVFSSIIGEDLEKNPLNYILDFVDIPYFESYTEDSIDFLMGLGFEYKKLYTNAVGVDPKQKFGATIIGFKKFTKISSTFEHCYCPEGLINVLNDLHPKFIEQLNDNL